MENIKKNEIIRYVNCGECKHIGSSIEKYNTRNHMVWENFCDLKNCKSFTICHCRDFICKITDFTNELFKEIEDI